MLSETLILSLILFGWFMCISMFVLAMVFGNLKYTFKGELSQKEFDVMMDLIFNDPNAKLDSYNMCGGGYECWIANGYQFFKVNDEARFTALQKIKFWRRLKQWKDIQEAKPELDKLNREKLNSLVFQKELEDKLSEK